MPVELARESILEGKAAPYLRDLDSVAGLVDQLALGMAAAVEHGLAGVERDLRAMVAPWGFALRDIEPPVRLWYGTDDVVFGPAAGRWLAERIPTARFELVEASHLLPLVRWESILTTLVAHLDRKDVNATQP